MSDFLNWEMTNRMHNLGYDGKTLMYIDDEKDIINDDSAELIGAKPAILTSAAFRWFRDKYELYSCINIFTKKLGDKKVYFIYEIRNPEQFELSEAYETYEEAELECLKTLIEIVESKSE